MTVTGKPAHKVTLALMVLVLASCGDAAVPAGTTEEQTQKVSSPTAPARSPGYDILEVTEFNYESVDYETADPEPEVILTASDRGELDALWTEIGSPRPVPSVDFGQQVVVAYLVGGSGSCLEHVARFDVDPDIRTAQAVFAAVLPHEVCTDDLRLRYHVAAIALIDLGPGPMTFSRIANRAREQAEPVVVDLPAHSGEGPSILPMPVDDVAHPAGVVPLPQPGEAISARLDDGMPVWAVAP
ncbi:hypothetical protein G1H11_02020 [Phytoactinopolyspora alkaliphila]|uniref:GerMN domain-containing protein n=1 Tax=Phytoactinopolyspora alkaliphila TaxID=1783498 RepID=A0A6N9YGM1_9ACTN|nr:hypothetical protein [Phytoactinopolyspora alkaliphila]NED94080.1 hypothetical protein [Phytoactinopolyspora alkaliphila]